MDIARDENGFMSALELEALPARALIERLTEAHDKGEALDLYSLAELLQEALHERNLRDAALELLQRRAEWHHNDPAFRQQCAELAMQALGYSAENRALIESAGFDQPLPAAECFRRLQHLRAFVPGMLVYHKTWGFGIVRQKDHFDRRVHVDFDKKPDHQFSFAYAAETLTILDDDHLLAIHHKQPARISELLDNQPDEVIRILIRSFGPQTVQQVQALMVPALIPEERWKPFWEKARKALKNDDRFDIPRKRSEPLRILEVEKGFNEHWFKALGNERDMEGILALIDEWLGAPERPELDPGFAGILADRLVFVIRGAGTRSPGLACRAILAAYDAQLAGADLDAMQRMRDLLDEASLLSTMADLPAKEIGRLLERLYEIEPERTTDLLLRLIPDMNTSMLNDSLDLLLARGCEQKVAGIMMNLTKDRQVADVEVLYWLYRHMDRLEQWKLGGANDLARWMLRVLNEQMTGEKLKTQNALRELFERGDWLSQVLGAMHEKEAREFMRRVKDCTGWDSITQRSIMAALIKIRPELAEVVVDAQDAESVAPQAARVTSRRSYYERQDQLERIRAVEIPEVAREIGVARSYGDLRENFEYKAAKEKQGLLMRRSGELEGMLAQVQPTDFENVSHDRVAQGTGVDIEYPDGTSERYYILGEWDRDESLGIISSQSRMAQALMGARAGQTVPLPSQQGDETTCLVRDVVPLSEDVRAWIGHLH